MTVIDGKNAILGRLSAMVAKKLQSGEDVIVVNAEKIIITGDPKVIVDKYLARRRIGSPQHGPFFPKQSDMIVRRAIRGMMPYKTKNGRAAMKKLRVHAGIPEGFKDTNMEKIAVKQVKSNFISIADVAKTLGGNR